MHQGREGIKKNILQLLELMHQGNQAGQPYTCYLDHHRLYVQHNPLCSNLYLKENS